MSIHDNARALAKGKRPVVMSEDLVMKLINELDVERLAKALVTASRSLAKSKWSFLRGDGWLAYDECERDVRWTQVFIVDEFAQAIAREYARLGEDES